MLTSNEVLIAFFSIAVGALVLFLFTSMFTSTATPQKAQKKSSKHKLLIRENKISPKEVSLHNTREDCWIIVDEKVYDVTNYVDEHPGGESILTNAGKDSTSGVHGPQHPPSMWDVLKLYYIGEIEK